MQLLLEELTESLWYWDAALQFPLEAQLYEISLHGSGECGVTQKHVHVT